MKKMVATFILLSGSVVFAKPEYAAKLRINCTACHMNPWGGGPRNVYGKIYGSKDFKTSPLSLKDTYAASLRGIAYYPKDNAQNKSGIALMEASISANVVAIEAVDGTSETRVVGTYNTSPLVGGLRETYVRVNPEKSNTTFITVGRFNSPFGLLTDEHRTYTKLQTGATLNDFVTGAAVSGVTAKKSIWYDMALVSDLRSGTTFSNQGVQYGGVANARWLPENIPLLFGMSQSFQHIQNQSDLYATSAYTVLSFDRMTEGKLPSSLLFEAVTAKNWNNSTVNPQLTSFFIPSGSTTYSDAVSHSQSLGIYSMIRYDVSPHWTVFYKWDSLTLDTNFYGDVFMRSGLGFEVALNSNTYLNARVERADVTKPEISNNNMLADQSDFIAMLRMWL